MRCGTQYTLAAMSLASILAGSSAAFARVIYVDREAPPGGDGERWDTAYDDLNAALGSAGNDDEIWVAANVYVPSGDRGSSFLLRTSVAVYGGFAGDEVSRDQRDWVLNETILSGDRNGDDGPDFENYDDNCIHVVDAAGTVEAVLDGFTIRGGRANGGGDERHGAGVFAGWSVLKVRHCAIRSNWAEVDGGGLFAALIGGVDIEECSFIENRAAVGAGLHADEAAVSVTGTTFSGNVAAAAGGGAFCAYGSSAVFIDCAFERNSGGYGSNGVGGGLVVGSTDLTVLAHCLFADNKTGFLGGGAAVSNGVVTNCAFSRNVADRGGGMYADDDAVVVNSTFGRNLGGGIGNGGPLQVANSIVWGNDGPPIESGAATVVYSDIEGGWAGVGNIDADPLFVQPGTDDLRLAIGSPCVDAGSNAYVEESVDLDGNPRIQNGTVDMGAYEGENEAQPARAETDDADDGEAVLLVPNGGGFDPEVNTLTIFTNRSGQDDAYASLTEYGENRHPAARGFSSLGTTGVLETSLEDGTFLAQMFIPFHEDDLDGADPFALDLTYYDEGVGNWALAVGRNAARSPGHRGPFGDRIAREGPGPWGVTLDVGDYGVFFNTQTRRGFVWANVDHPADFSSGLALCPADTWQPPDSSVDFDDILAVIDNWGAGPGPFDVNGDGLVDVDDLLEVLSAWGGCE